MSQNSIQLPTSGTLGGLQGITDINAALDTLNTKWAGAGAPAEPEAGQYWLDTSTGILRIRSGDNAAWIPLTNMASGGPFVGVSSAKTLGPSDHGLVQQANMALTITLGASSTLGLGWKSYVMNDAGPGSSTIITVAGNGSDTFDADAPTTIYVLPGETVEITANGSGKFWTRGRSVGLNPGRLRVCLSPTADPGTLILNGALLSRATFPQLWAYASPNAVSESQWSSGYNGSFSVGDGSTTFRLPDVRGEFIRALDDGRGIDASRAFGSWQPDDFKSHSHSAGAQNANTGLTGGPTPYPAYGGNVGYTGGSETRPRNIAWLYCITY